MKPTGSNRLLAPISPVAEVIIVSPLELLTIECSSHDLSSYPSQVTAITLDAKDIIISIPTHNLHCSL